MRSHRFMAHVILCFVITTDLNNPTNLPYTQIFPVRPVASRITPFLIEESRGPDDSKSSEENIQYKSQPSSKYNLKTRQVTDLPASTSALYRNGSYSLLNTVTMPVRPSAYDLAQTQASLHHPQLIDHHNNPYQQLLAEPVQKTDIYPYTSSVPHDVSPAGSMNNETQFSNESQDISNYFSQADSFETLSKALTMVLEIEKVQKENLQLTRNRIKTISTIIAHKRQEVNRSTCQRQNDYQLLNKHRYRQGSEVTQIHLLSDNEIAIQTHNPRLTGIPHQTTVTTNTEVSRSNTDNSDAVSLASTCMLDINVDDSHIDATDGIDLTRQNYGNVQAVGQSQPACSAVGTPQISSAENVIAQPIKQTTKFFRPFTPSDSTETSIQELQQNDVITAEITNPDYNITTDKSTAVDQNGAEEEIIEEKISLPTSEHLPPVDSDSEMLSDKFKRRGNKRKKPTKTRNTNIDAKRPIDKFLAGSDNFTSSKPKNTSMNNPDPSQIHKHGQSTNDFRFCTSSENDIPVSTQNVRKQNILKHEKKTPKLDVNALKTRVFQSMIMKDILIKTKDQRKYRRNKNAKKEKDPDLAAVNFQLGVVNENIMKKIITEIGEKSSPAARSVRAFHEGSRFRIPLERVVIENIECHLNRYLNLFRDLKDHKKDNGQFFARSLRYYKENNLSILYEAVMSRKDFVDIQFGDFVNSEFIERDDESESDMRGEVNIESEKETNLHPGNYELFKEILNDYIQKNNTNKQVREMNNCFDTITKHGYDMQTEDIQRNMYNIHVFERRTRELFTFASIQQAIVANNEITDLCNRIKEICLDFWIMITADDDADVILRKFHIHYEDRRGGHFDVYFYQDFYLSTLNAMLGKSVSTNDWTVLERRINNTAYRNYPNNTVNKTLFETEKEWWTAFKLCIDKANELQEELAMISLVNDDIDSNTVKTK